MVAVWSSLEEGDVLRDYQDGIALSSLVLAKFFFFARFLTTRMSIFLFLVRFYCCGTPERYITSVTGLGRVLYIVTRAEL